MRWRRRSVNSPALSWPRRRQRIACTRNRYRWRQSTARWRTRRVVAARQAMLNRNSGELAPWPCSATHAIVVALDVDGEVAVRDDVVGVRDDEHLAELGIGDGVQLFEERSPAIGVLAAEHLVEHHESGLSSALASDGARQGKTQTQPSEILLAAGVAAQGVQLTAVGNLKLVAVVELDRAVAPTRDLSEQ